MGTWKFRRRFVITAGPLALMPVLLGGCLGLKSPDEKVSQTQPDSCVQELPSQPITGSDGEAMAFLVDPIIASGNPNLSPTSTRLDQYRSQVTLRNLSGYGVLAGKYVNVRNGITCDGWYQASDPDNHFNYSQRDPRFGEAMTYHYGDTYREKLDQAGYLSPAISVPLIAHCEKQDNAYFVRGTGQNGQTIQYVCLGDSVATPGASYSDDATVAVHELQHATTINTYSLTQELNQLWYDEAGALNEALSDFLALTFLDPMVTSAFDPRVFSRWALGTYFGRTHAERGVHRCPTYDPGYPNCAGFNADPQTGGFSAAASTLSYAYPDGVGWPYPNNYSAPGYLRQAFLNSSSKEEIHNNSTVIAGALWDIYEALRANHGGSADQAHQLASQLAMEAVKRLPKPTTLLRSPVTFRGYATQLVTAASLLGFSSADQASVSSALTARGLLGSVNILTAGWAQVGPGSASSPGLRIVDNASVLRDWLDFWIGAPSSVVTQVSANGKASPGDAIAVWFDLGNASAVTAGGINLRISTTDSNLTFLDGRYNAGFVSASQSQIQYSKVNGSAIVSALSSSNTTFHVPTGTSYFLTNPDYIDSPVTAVWLKVNASAAPGTMTSLRVEVIPSNGPTETLDFPVSIN